MKSINLQFSGRPLRFFSILLFFSIAANAQLAQNSTKLFQNTKALVFIENKGQIKDNAGHRRDDILFMARSGSTNIFLRKTGISYVFNTFPVSKSRFRFLNDAMKKDDVSDKISKSYRLDLEFIKCNPNCKTAVENPSESYTNYYLPQCPDGLLHIKSYGRITYLDIYPGIDVIFYPGSFGLEYDFVVHSGADPAQIKLKYIGADQIKLSKAGSLTATFKNGSLTETAPKVYTVANGKNTEVPSGFEIGSDKQTVSFRLGPYPGSDKLIIDPSVQWSTYIGGSGIDYPTVLAIDKDSNVYGVAGTTSIDFPVTTGAFQKANADTVFGYGDVAIFKYTAGGIQLWSTYYGGSFYDYDASGNGPGIAVDHSGNIVIAGVTGSRDFPVTVNAFQTKFPGNADAFLVKFDPSGKRIWGSYYGDTASGTSAIIVAIDVADNIYITGASDSKTLQGSRTNYVVSGKSYNHVFVAKFSPACKRIWTLLYGGSATPPTSSYPYDAATDITVDDSTNVIVVGDTKSDNFPVQNPVITGFYTMMGSSFVMKFDSAGKRRWASVLGGTTKMVDATTDKNGNIYFTGEVITGLYPVIKNGYQTSMHGGADAFLFKFSPDGKIIWSTYFDGSDFSAGTGVIADGNENITMCGVMRSTDMPVKDAFQTKNGGGALDGFIAKFNKVGSLVWSSYYGGDKADNPTDIEHDQRGNLYMCGINTDGDLPVKKAYQDSFAGASDGFITKILDCNGLYSNVKVSAKNFCLGDTVVLSADPGYDTYKWTNGETTSSIKVTKSGTYSASIAYKGGCNGSTQAITLHFSNPPVSGIQASGPLSFCDGDSVNLSATGVYPTYHWSTGATTATIEAKKTGKYKLTTYNTGGCSVSDSVVVIVKAQPHPTVKGANNLLVCGNKPIALDAGTGYTTYKWNTGETTQKINVSSVDSFRVSVDSANGCSGMSPWVHTRKFVAKIAVNGLLSRCNGDSVVLDAGFGFANYEWNTGQTTQLIKAGRTGKYTVIVTGLGGCVDTSKPVQVTIFAPPPRPIITQKGNSLESSHSFTYQWIKSGANIKGETDQELLNVKPGYYMVKTIDSNGCVAYSDSFLVESDYFKIYPNPTTAALHIDAAFSNQTDLNYYLVDMLGRVLINFDDGIHNGTYNKILDMENFARGMYILKVKAGDTTYTNKIVKYD